MIEVLLSVFPLIRSHFWLNLIVFIDRSVNVNANAWCVSFRSVKIVRTQSNEVKSDSDIIEDKHKAFHYVRFFLSILSYRLHHLPISVQKIKKKYCCDHVEKKITHVINVSVSKQVCAHVHIYNVMWIWLIYLWK